ncbi:MAG: Flp pilus assembly complex ATPase component TadA [Candidatus Omnitrophica bacterium]|nr:Flp pilus assembly complex ATPase component TadA [Candidatus Omnitrophota bacterium]MBU1048343.1 Flp pilus assembly complex ATPase component TadA [Candidatus Omnitrophota bacterium]MBU1630912.1 Flp pilus assembly complex ATPase component TadA [Candidatus Omnitrophota bacterium]MBU1766946.1 Flp pilus assembly complex ATPase component TadA [Candidatus Omnitrophota bacterium]MBU1889675.1 Flp pilus assembly complex ATPase component TadA [Candidatus Omnitrophota bacterium]
MSPEKKHLIGEILKDKGLITEEQLENALSDQRASGKLLGKILVDKGFVSEADILSVLSVQLGMKEINLSQIKIPKDLLDRVPSSIAKAYKIVPIRMESNTLVVAMGDPMNVQILDDLRFMLDCEVKGLRSNEEDVNETIEKFYGEKIESIEDLLKEVEAMTVSTKEEETSTDLAALEEMARQLPIVKLVNLVLIQAIKDRASDIHFEPFEDQFKIRYRVDGILYEMLPPPKHFAIPVTTRIKVMAQMDIAERRKPQDGRIALHMGGNEIDMRVSTLPTLFGESVVMRVLDKSVLKHSLDELGFQKSDLVKIRKIIKKPNGIILVTGPTGCGKTTTLYAALMELNSIETKIITTEEPVEYDVEGIIQVPINAAIGLTFDRCLRSILRQDPDIILVGEVRDLPTAEMSIHSSLTGHLVFSTLHTNDAPSTITRLLDMGVESYLMASTLEAVISQRLVRMLCQQCKEEYTPKEEELTKLGVNKEEIKDVKFYKSKGCPVCNNIGFIGRIGLFEIMILNEELRELIGDKATTSKIRNAAVKHGMGSLRDDGIDKIKKGITTIEEIIRETTSY